MSRNEKELKEGKVRVCVWSDNTWCFMENIEEYSFMSDDYIVIYVPEELDEESIEYIIEECNAKRRLAFNE